jgi:hypothetical protein
LETQNAIITRVELEGERGLSAWIDLDYGGMCQSFGGYMLLGGNKNYCGTFIRRCLDVGGVMEWSKLVGKTVRVKRDQGLAVAIGHIVKDDWFEPRKDLQQTD